MSLPRFSPPRLCRKDVNSYIYPLLLAALTLLVFQEGSTHKFTNWDDWKYIVDNPLVQGISFDRVRTAFTEFHVYNYNPLHIISYMVDYEVWGLKAGGFFLTSLVLHLLGGVFFYYFALRLLRSGEAAFVCAAVFLVHPTRIESVAWLSERKDVLSGFFGAATLLVYLKHVERLGEAQAWALPGRTPTPSRSASEHRLGWTLPVVAWILFLLALLSKSQLVTLPVVLVAMDLCRGRSFRGAIVSKVPYFFLSAVFSLLTVSAHAEEGSKGVQFPESILVPLAALPRYLFHMVWPLGLSPYYDFGAADFHSPVFVAAGAALLALFGICAWRSYCRERVWFFAIAWFLAFLAPVIGLVRINILLADRYLYIAIVGPALAVAKTVLDAPRARAPALAAALATLTLFAAVSISYLPTFHDTESLWARVLEVCPGASMAHSNLGALLRSQGRVAEAAEHYDADLAEKPYFEESFLGRAAIHEGMGEMDAARALYERLLEKRPGSASARIEYADFLERAGEPEKGLAVLLHLDPLSQNALYHSKLSDIYRKLNRPHDALAAARRAVELDPYDPLAQLRLRSAVEASQAPLEKENEKS